ncbi:MAG: hypothetical protein KGZ81_03510 [Flavobacteriales bacterium]|nr:hypothetical protein [Flavobacteriales bacterium]
MVVFKSLINKYFQYFIKINYFAQKFFGWKEFPIQGLRTFVVTKIFFYSSGFTAAIALFSFRELTMFIYIIYGVFYFLFLQNKIEMKLEKFVDFQNLDEEYSKTSTLKKVIFTIISFCSIIMNVVGMVLIIYFYSRFFQ